MKSLYDVESIAANISVEDIVIRKDELKCILRAIDSLDEDIKNLMILRLINNLSYDEISNILNKSKVWARVNFFRAKKRIFEIIGDD